MFIAAMYIWKYFVQIFYHWLKELGSLSALNGSSDAKSIFAIIDASKEMCEILFANIILNGYWKKLESIRILVACSYAILLLLVTVSQLQSRESK